MSVKKSSVRIMTFTGADCRVTVTDQVVLEVHVAGGRQVINFPVHRLPDVAGLLGSAAADRDSRALVERHAPQPESGWSDGRGPLDLVRSATSDERAMLNVGESGEADGRRR